MEDIFGISILFGENSTVSDILSAISQGCGLCETCSAPLLVLCNSRILHVAPMMRGHLVYYELLLLSQVGIMVCGWNKIIWRFEYRLICGEGLLISWESLYLLLPDIRFCIIIEDESLCLHCTVPLWSGSWMFEPLSLNYLLCDYLEKLTDTWCSWKSLPCLKW